MEIKEAQFTAKVRKDGTSEVCERVYYVKDFNGFPVGKVTFRGRLITFEAVGQAQFSMNEDSQIEAIRYMYDENE